MAMEDIGRTGFFFDFFWRGGEASEQESSFEVYFGFARNGDVQYIYIDVKYTSLDLLA